MVPCCFACNKDLNHNYEQPISAAFNGGFSKFAHLFESDPVLVQSWLALVFFKTHLKDLYFRKVGKGVCANGSLSDQYNWLDFHHLHALFRAPLVGNHVDPNVIGSTILMEVTNDHGLESFDYRDHLATQSLLLRSGDIAIAVVFDDCCQCLHMIDDIIGTPPKIGPLQSLEILTELQTAALHLRNRPTFRTEFNTLNGRFAIRCEKPANADVLNYDPKIRAFMMEYNFSQYLPNDVEAMKKIKDGIATTFNHQNMSEEPNRRMIRVNVYCASDRAFLWALKGAKAPRTNLPIRPEHSAPHRQ